ncbi:MAG: FHA domain-containing protein [Chthoniobacteraceae bacterium]
MPKLQIVRPDGSSTDHEITEETLTIGRAPDNIFPIDDVSVSSHHAQIAPSAGIFLLKDLGSTNGTMVNGTDLQPETEYTLKAGDRIRFGHVDSIFDPEHADANAQALPANVERSVTPAAKSMKPSNFMNASPFQKRTTKKDTVGIAVMGVGILAIVAALAVLFLATQMKVS